MDFLELDWSAGTPLDAISRAGFAMHRELAGELGAERIGYRPTDALMTAAADAEDVERHRRLPNPAWFDGDVVAHEVIGDGVEHAAGAVVLALGPWTDRAQRWLALPQVLGTRMASVVLGADLPARTACPGSLDASPFALTRLPPGRMSAGMGDSAP